jgi:membrane-associated phospholipid phosphatase
MSTDQILRFFGTDFPQLSPTFHANLDILSWSGQIAVPAAAGLYALWKNDLQGFCQLAIALVVNQACIEILKKYVVETRPNGRAGSFPSGHTAAAFLGVVFLGSRYSGQPLLCLVALNGALFVGASRVLLRAHFLHDVLAGAVMGGLIGRIFAFNIEETR